VKYGFIRDHRAQYPVATMCRVFRVQRSGFYAWLRQPVSDRGRENLRLLGLIRSFYAESGGLYGSPRLHKDLKEFGECCGENRVARLMRQHGIRAQRGYKRPRHKAGPPALAAPDRVKQQFSVAQANRVWVTDITYIRTYEGWLYLAVVIDLFSRHVVGWSMKSTLTREIVLDALLMAIW
jgi:putative transposase